MRLIIPVKTKLLVQGIIIFAMLVAVAIFSIGRATSLAKLSTDLDRTHDFLTLTRSLQQANLALNENLNLFIATRDTRWIDSYNDIVASVFSPFQLSQANRNEPYSKLHHFGALHPQLRSYGLEIIALTQDSQPDVAIDLYQTSFSPLYEETNVLLDRTTQELNDQFTQLTARNRTVIDQTLQQGFTVLILIGIALVLASFYLFNSITKPLRQLIQAAHDFGEGKSNVKVNISSNDEFGELATVFNTMAQKLSRREKELKAFNTKLTTQVADRTKEIEKQLKKVTKLNKALDKQKHQAVFETSQLTAILQSIGEGVFVLNEKRQVILTNAATEELADQTSIQLRGKNYRKFLWFAHEKHPEEKLDFIEQVFTTGKPVLTSRDAILVRNSGTIPVQGLAAPIFGDKGKKTITGCVVVFRDASTERAIDRMKSEFVSVASHQLRTPLTGIKWFSDMLLNNKAGELSIKQKQFVEEIYQGNERMLMLIQDLLNISRIENGDKFDIRLTKSDVVKILTEEISNQKIYTKQRNVVIKGSKLPKSYIRNIDPTKIRHVFRNIINNAVKYSKPNSVVTISFTRSKNKGKNLYDTFAIKDTGIGIPKKQQTQVYSKFFRANNALKHQVEGTGLGLYIAKAVLEKHGGSLSFESSVRSGTTFYISFPSNRT